MDVFAFADVERLEDDLWVLEEMGSNIFIVKGAQKVLIIDTAYGLTDLRAAAKVLCGDLPVTVINTHGHPDHNCGNGQFDSVLVGRFDEPASHRKYDEAGKAHLIEFMGARLHGYPFDAEKWRPAPARRVEPVTDGDYIDLGGLRFTVIETPGHSLGSIALYEPERRWLFTGDTVLTWEVWGQLENSAALRVYAQSLERLAEYENKIDCVFPAHVSSQEVETRSRFRLPPRILSVYAKGTREIVEGKVVGRPYEERNPRFAGCRYVLFDIGGMAYDPGRI